VVVVSSSSSSCSSNLLGEAAGCCKRRVDAVRKARCSDHHRLSGAVDRVQGGRDLRQPVRVRHGVDVGKVDHTRRTAGPGHVQRRRQVIRQPVGGGAPAVDRDQARATLGGEPPAQRPLAAAGRPVQQDPASGRELPHPRDATVIAPGRRFLSVAAGQSNQSAPVTASEK